MPEIVHAEVCPVPCSRCMQSSHTIGTFLVGSCPNGLPAVGPCVNGMCGTGYVCNLANNLCCTPGMRYPLECMCMRMQGAEAQVNQKMHQLCVSACANGLIPVGPCVNGQCGTGFTCNTATNMCCPSLASKSF